MDHLQTRLEALEHRTHTVERQLRWWRGLACGLAVAGLLGWGLPLGLAREEAREKDKDPKGLAQRVAALEKLPRHFSRGKNDIFITGANLHIVNGLGRTDCGPEEEPIPDCPNGLGNLIVGYNEPRDGEDIRTGSHNVVVGQGHNFSRFGGLVVGNSHEISGDFAVVSGGDRNTASGNFAVVSGGSGNTADGESAWAGGGRSNLASGARSVVLGGSFNTASGDWTLVSGGGTIPGTEGAGNTASGLGSSVSGGQGNTASGDFAAVSGGQNITEATDFGWSAGSEGDEVVVGNFRSP
jgi:trimeric autotransporter adhesin